MRPEIILFPSSYFSETKPDEDLPKEYDAVQQSGLFDTVLFSYEKWFLEGKLKLNCSVDRPVFTVYRVWMMKPDTSMSIVCFI